jgi:hypothetical protein
MLTIVRKAKHDGMTMEDIIKEHPGMSFNANTGQTRPRTKALAMEAIKEADAKVPKSPNLIQEGQDPFLSPLAGNVCDDDLSQNGRIFEFQGTVEFEASSQETTTVVVAQIPNSNQEIQGVLDQAAMSRTLSDIPMTDVFFDEEDWYQNDNFIGCDIMLSSAANPVGDLNAIINNFQL